MLESRKSMFLDVLMKPGRSLGVFRNGGRLMAVLRGGVLALLLLFCVSPIALAQSPSTGTYRIVSGDVLQIDVSGRADVSGQYTVDKDGGVKLPVLGVVSGEGRTTTELATDISRRISLVSRDIPQVTVSVVEAFRRKNFVLGAVLLPGSYSFSKGPTVWEAISTAGGPSDDADLSAVQVISETQLTPVLVDVATAVRSGDLGSLPRLRPGDTVRVPRGSGAARGTGTSGDVIYVFGAVASPGAQPLSESADLVRALLHSSPAPEANLTRIEIVRRSGPRVVSMRVNMADYVANAKLAGNPQLQPGDTVFLPRRATTDYLRIIGFAVGIITTAILITNNY